MPRTLSPTLPEWLYESPIDGSLLVLVPAGEFVAGGSERHEGRSGRFPVQLPAFYIALHAVTNAQYRRFLRAADYPPPRHGDFGDHVWRAGEPADDDFEGKAHHPVVHVTWHDAASYAHWAGLRLPTELEWEKAARGSDGRRFPWGEDWDPERCRNDESRRRETTSDVWSHPRSCSHWGCYQMSGNVWEWCADWFAEDAYRRYARGERAPPERGEERVVRGGSWFNAAAESFQACSRFGLAPLKCGDHYGFRLALDAVRAGRRDG